MRAAVGLLEQHASIVAKSRVYETAPVGPAQPDFLNAAVVALAELRPEELLDALLAIESRLGRARRERWGPRVIDLDVLWIDGVAVDGPRLVVPHPHLRERAFALAPMLELVPAARDPRTDEPYVVPPGDVRLTDLAL
jgi:2-amino-4-hydroxy-6-hydroxymethyldihydropteridine diphosphokinase